MLYGSVGRVGLRALSGTSFSPLSLFANGEQGGWYDPSDLTTLFQDAAGTTPVTAVEQPVGLVLDKSKGLVLGSELVSNSGPNFTATTGWTLSGGTGASLSVVSGALRATNGSAGYAGGFLSFATIAGVTYKVSFSIPSTGRGRVGTGPALADLFAAATGTQTAYIRATGTTTYFSFYVNSATAGDTTDLAYISVREIPGNHLSQSTAAARPVLSARVNALTYTEDFSNAAWVKGAGATATASVLSAVAGTGNHWVYRNNAPTGAQTFSVEAKAGTTSWIALGQGLTGAAYNTFFNLSNGTRGTVADGHTASIIDVGDGWHLCSVTLDFTTTNASIAITNADKVAVGWNAVGTETINIRKADLRPANAGVGLPAYQRVTTATDYDTTGFPLFLRFDGTDDFLVSATISPGSVDKAQVFAGVRKLSDAAIGTVVSLGGNTNVAGFFQVFVPRKTTAEYGVRAFTSASLVVDVQSSTKFAGPDTGVITSFLDAAASSSNQIVMRRNATEIAKGGSSINTTFASTALTVGQRGTDLPFNGHLYQLLVRFSATNLDAATITSTETWVNQRTKAF